MTNKTQRAAAAGAIFSALSMLLLSLAHILNVYTGAVGMMQEWHMYYTPTTISGTLTGMIEASLITYLSILLISWIYGQLNNTKKK